MKPIYKSALCVVALFALLCLLNAHRSFVHSPDGRKTLTVFRPVSWFWRSDYYLIPGRYPDFFPPETNYALIEPVGFCWLEVNWAPLDGHALKMALTSGCVRDRLSSRVYMSPTGAFDNYRDDEPYQPPKHMSYPMSELLQ